VRRHRFLRELHGLKRRLASSLFIRVIERAHQYRVTDIKTLENMARLLVRDDAEFLPTTTFNEEYEIRRQYLDGQLTDPPDLDTYEQLLEGDDCEQ